MFNIYSEKKLQLKLLSGKKTARSCIVSVSIEKHIQFFEVCLKLVGPVSLPKRFWNKFQSQISSALSNLRFWVSRDRYTLWRTNLLFKPTFLNFSHTIVNNRAIS